MVDDDRDRGASGPEGWAAPTDDETVDLLDIAYLLRANLKLLVIAPLVAGLAALGATYLITPTFTARTTFLPPQQQQGMAATALASLGALAGLAGGAAGIKSPADQYVSLMQSTTVQDRLIDQYNLMQVYDTEYRYEARKTLRDNVSISLGKKDGLISVEVDDEIPQRAADLANSHVEELRRMTNLLAVTEAQQRRAFFEEQLQRSKRRLSEAQQALQASGFTQGALKSEPKAAAESYARLRAEVTAAEVRLQTMRSFLSETAPELLQQQANLAALRSQLARAEQAAEPGADSDYIGRYREFKYEETLFELFARQYEMARVDESLEGGLVQVVDRASPPERKSRPKRVLAAIGATLVTALALCVWLVGRQRWRRVTAQREAGADMARVRSRPQGR